MMLEIFYSRSKLLDAESMLSLSVSKTRSLRMCVVVPRHLLKTSSLPLFSKHCQADHISFCSNNSLAISCAAFLFPQILAGVQHVVCLRLSGSLKTTECSSMGALFLLISVNIDISSFFGSSKLHMQRQHVLSSGARRIQSNKFHRHGFFFNHLFMLLKTFRTAEMSFYVDTITSQQISRYRASLDLQNMNNENYMFFLLLEPAECKATSLSVMVFKTIFSNHSKFLKRRKCGPVSKSVFAMRLWRQFLVAAYLAHMFYSKNGYLNLLSADHALLTKVVQKICLSCRPKTDKLVLVSGSFAPVHKIAQHMKLLYISNPNM
jgi:hypothetical protein